MSVPSLSIIIPVYNGSRFMPQLFATLTAQGIFSPECPVSAEVIFVDDGSTDNSVDLIREFATAHHNIRLLQQKNQRQSAARNYGLREAEMEYVYMMDQDDILTPDTLVPHVMIAHGQKSDIVRFDFDMPQPESIPALRNLAPHSSRPKITKIYTDPTQYIIDTNYLYSKTSVWTSIINRRFIVDNGIEFNPQAIMLEDGIFVWKMMLKASKLVLTDSVGYHWIQYPDSDIHKQTDRHQQKRLITWPHTLRSYNEMIADAPRTHNGKLINERLRLYVKWYEFAYWSLVLKERALSLPEAIRTLAEHESWGIYPIRSSYPSEYPQYFPQTAGIRLRWYMITRPILLKVALRLKLNKA